MLDIAVAFLILIFLLFIGIPVGVSLILASLYNLLAGGAVSLMQIPHMFYASFDHFTLLAIPMFIYAADILMEGNITDMVFDFANAVFGRFPGGLGSSAIASTMLFAGISGSSAADAAAIGKIGTQGMAARGYGKPYSAALIATSSTLAILIPPSIAMIIYGSLSGASIGSLFFAGILPGILIGIGLMAFNTFFAWRKGYHAQVRASVWKTGMRAVWVVFLPVFILYGFYTGAYTPTEIGTITVLYSMLITRFVYRTLRFKDFITILKKSALTNASLFLIIAGAILFSKIFTQRDMAHTLIEFIKAEHLSPNMFLIYVSLGLTFLGMFLEGVALNVMTTPLLLPALNAMGIDLVHYGVILVLNIEIALITPPVGLNLFILSAATDVSLNDLFKNIFPFVLIMILGLLLIIFFPSLSLIVPNFFLGNH